MMCHRALIAASFFVCLAATASAADPVSWIPADVNAIARVNVAEIYKSPLAQKEGWVKKAAESFVQQEAFIPPGTTQILVGAALDITDNLLSGQKYAVLVPDAKTTLESLSSWLPGDIESVSGKTLAHYGNDGYVADTGDGCWLTNGNSNRQAITRWMRNGPTPNGNQLSPYLRTALTSKENTAPVLLAIELQDCIPGRDIRTNLKATDWFKTDAAMETVAKILESVKGITISVSVDNERTGKAVVDFGKDTAVLQPLMDKLVESIMQRVGISANDVQGWKWTTKGNQVIGSGPVSAGGARRLISILDPPSITHSISASAAEAPKPEENPSPKISLKYCKSVQVLLNDLRQELHSATYNYALYFERYARKIDDLPTLHVDPALLDFSGKVSNSLRYQGEVQRMSSIRAGTQNAQAFASGGVGYNGYGYYRTAGVGTGIANNAAANETAKGVRFSEWKQIEDGLVTIRRAMTEKYQIQF